MKGLRRKARLFGAGCLYTWGAQAIRLGTGTVRMGLALRRGGDAVRPPAPSYSEAVMMGQKLSTASLRRPHTEPGS